MAPITAGDPTTMNCSVKPVVFYDGGCSLCRSEIAHYQRIDREHKLGWVDISRETELVRSYALTVEQMMQRIHVLDIAGTWQTGSAGFIELRAHLPYYHRWSEHIFF
jgi:predicted DCC family thiol-disulfide oxidoreductase YuxK